MNLPYLIKILETEKLSDLVENIDLVPLDLDLELEAGVERGEIELDKENNTVRALKEPEISFNSDLAAKLLKTMQNYWKKEMNITRGRLNTLIKDPMTRTGYGWHEYLMALQYLLDSGQIVAEEVDVPEGEGSRKEKRRPAHKFVFLQSPDNPNEDWNKKAVNNWIATFNKKK